MGKHLKILAVLHIVWGSLATLLGLGVGVVLVGLATYYQEYAAATGSPNLAADYGTILKGSGIVLMGLSASGLVGGVGLLMRRRWARPLLLAVSLPSLLLFPLGTGLAIYTFWVLFDEASVAQLVEPTTDTIVSILPRRR